MRLFSWNVNGVRAATKKGLFEWLEHESPDILCIQKLKPMWINWVLKS